ncbi:MAG: FCD domain-containing protein [Betaproteobacteria bacterium]|nr:FCD domain-containing protein [Betaproteobacteria bacterium]
MPQSTAKPTEDPPLAARVHADIERQILSGKVLPGAKLVEEDVADRLRVSRGPVREAFRALEQAGLVRMEKNRGVFVREVSLREADEIYEVRAGLDELIGRLVAARLTAARLAELRRLLTRMELAARTEDVDSYYPLNVAFHDHLALAAGNGTLLASYRILVNQLHLYRRETLARGAGSFDISTSEHQRIVDLLAEGDGVKAGQLLFEHAMESRERLHATLQTPIRKDAGTP